MNETEITCAIAFDYIRQQCVKYNPANRYKISSDTFGRDGKVKEYKPNYPKNIEGHIRSCTFCTTLERHLSHLNLPEGALSVELKVRGLEGIFQGTPDEIIDGLGIYLLPPSKINDAGATIKMQLLSYLSRMIGPTITQIADPVTGHITSEDLIRECVSRKILAIEADPWFVLSERPVFLIS